MNPQHAPDHEPFAARSEYQQTAADRMVECTILTSELDTLMETPVGIGSDVESRATVDVDGMLITRSFRYIESDKPYEWAWPLVEKTLDISYHRTNDRLTTETYRIATGSIIHQDRATKDPIVNVFEIKYFGKDRQSVTATIEHPNFVEPDLPDFETRETTPYDHVRLFEEVASFRNLLSAEAAETTNIKRVTS